MSIQAVGWVLDHSATKGIDRLVMIALANHANVRGECWPAQRTIARECGGIASSTVHEACKRITTDHADELEVIEPGGPRRATRYRLPFADVEPVDNKAPRSAPEHKNARLPSAALGPGESAALGSGPSRTVSNRKEPLGDAARRVVGVGANGPLREYRAGDDAA